MINFLKDILIDFVLFSAIEGFIFCLFFTKVCDCKKFKFYQWLLLSFINCLISKLFPPVIYQAIMILWMSILLYNINGKDKYKYCFISSSVSLGMFLVTEILYSILLNKIMNVELLKFFMSDFEQLKSFIFLIPLRIIEIMNIFIIRRIKMKVILGGVVRK